MAKVFVQHQVADYDAWITVFNEHEAVRKSQARPATR